MLALNCSFRQFSHQSQIQIYTVNFRYIFMEAMDYKIPFDKQGCTLNITHKRVVQIIKCKATNRLVVCRYELFALTMQLLNAD
jgi:hypothetical protein